jgi:hypothetical protein
MNAFDGDCRSLVDDEVASEIEGRLRQLDAMKRASVDGYALSPVAKAPAFLANLAQFGIRRSLELAHASIRECNGRHLACAALLARAAIETGAFVMDIARKADGVVRTGETSAARPFVEDLRRSTLGGKSGRFRISEEHVATNILTVIGHLDAKPELPLAGFYDWLSEVAHPNYHGMMGLYRDAIDGAVCTFADQRSDSKPHLNFIAQALAVALMLTLEASAGIDEVLPDFAKLCERAIWEEGSWPAGIEYPVRR